MELIKFCSNAFFNFFFTFFSSPLTSFSTSPPLFYLPCALLMILPRDSTGGALPRPHCPTHRAHVIMRIWVYPIGTTCRKYSDPSSASRSFHMHSYVIFEPSRFLRESVFFYSLFFTYCFTYSEKLFCYNLGEQSSVNY